MQKKENTGLIWKTLYPLELCECLNTSCADLVLSENEIHQAGVQLELLMRGGRGLH